MATYLVKVETRHEERYFVQADSEQQARATWSEADMDVSECVEVLGVLSVEQVEE